MGKRGVVRYPELIALRMEPEMRKALERVAEEEDRSVASLIRIVLRDWLNDRESDPSQKKKPKRP